MMMETRVPLLVSTVKHYENCLGIILHTHPSLLQPFLEMFIFLLQISILDSSQNGK